MVTDLCLASSPYRGLNSKPSTIYKILHSRDCDGFSVCTLRNSYAKTGEGPQLYLNTRHREGGRGWMIIIPSYRRVRKLVDERMEGADVFWARAEAAKPPLPSARTHPPPPSAHPPTSSRVCEDGIIF